MVKQLRLLLSEMRARYRAYKDRLQPLMRAYDTVAGMGAAASVYTNPSLHAISLAYRRVQGALLRCLRSLGAGPEEGLDSRGVAAAYRGREPPVKRAP